MISHRPRRIGKQHTPVFSIARARIARLVVVLVSMLLVASGPAREASADAEAVPVFVSGTEGYRIYRIPAIVRAANGDLLAFCEARAGGDASEIDLVMKRSSDQGRTWGPLQVVQENSDFRELFQGDPPPITVGNPAPVVDSLDPEHPGRIWLPFTIENDWVFIVYSDDHGASWSTRRDITDQVKKKTWGWYATGPVHSIQIQRGPHRGRLVIPADHRLGVDGADRGPNGAQAILSDDHGKTWRLGAIDATYEDGLNANETTVVELNDGRLYFNTRDQNGAAEGTRGDAYSSDGGESFDATENPAFDKFVPSSSVLDPPVVQSSLLRAASKLDGDDRNLLLFCGPDQNGPSGPGRTDLRIRYSTDETRTWQDGPLIHTGPAAYSDLVRLDKDRVGVLFEAGDQNSKNPYQRIAFATVSTAKGFGKADPEPAPSESSATDAVRDAIAEAIPLIERGAAGSADQRKCFTCHSQAMPLLALTAARAEGFEVDEVNLDRQRDHTLNHLKRGFENYLKGKGQGGQVITAGYALWALEASGHQPDKFTQAVTHYLLTYQAKQGRWSHPGNRPPTSGSDYTTSYVALRGLKTFGTEEQQPDVTRRHHQLQAWLAKATPKDTEDRVFELHTLVYLTQQYETWDAGKQRMAQALAELQALQHDDGGWSQTKKSASDAYATATVLVALHQAGDLKSDDPAYRRGIQFLLNDQLSDGSWHVKTRADGFQTYFESGFPHGDDQFISIAASSWAVLALLPVVSSSKSGDESQGDRL